MPSCWYHCFCIDINNCYYYHVAILLISLIVHNFIQKWAYVFVSIVFLWQVIKDNLIHIAWNIRSFLIWTKHSSVSLPYILNKNVKECKKLDYCFITCCIIYREWQMERSFQTSMTIHRPDVVFILGNLYWVSMICNTNRQ